MRSQYPSPPNTSHHFPSSNSLSALITLEGVRGTPAAHMNTHCEEEDKEETGIIACSAYHTHSYYYMIVHVVYSMHDHE